MANKKFHYNNDKRSDSAPHRNGRRSQKPNGGGKSAARRSEIMEAVYAKYSADKLSVPVSALGVSEELVGMLALNGISTAAISAFTATTRVENFSQAFGISGCEAIAIFVAQNQGAKKHRRALDGFWNGAAMVVGIGVVFSLLLTFGGHALVTPFLDGDGESIALGASYLLWMGPFYFLSFIQGLETFHVEAGVVYEYIVACLIRDETIAFLVVKPFYCTSAHSDTSKK